jgi:hypothetical protein
MVRPALRFLQTMGLPMRYIVQDQVLDKHHFKHPGRTVYFVLDLVTRRLGMAYYLTPEKAQEVCDRKNEELK